MREEIAELVHPVVAYALDLRLGWTAARSRISDPSRRNCAAG